MVKVLAIVSPYAPSFSPQLSVHRRPVIPPVALFTTHYSLPTFPLSLFSDTSELPLLNDRFPCPLFSYNYELLFSQVLYFHTYLRFPIVFSLRSDWPSSLASPIDLYVFCFLTVTTPFSSTRLFSHLYKTPRVFVPLLNSVPSADSVVNRPVKLMAR